MISTSFLSYEEIDPEKKDPQWANRVITYMRRDWRRLTNIDRTWADRATLYSVNELSDVKNSFDDEEFKRCTKFQALPILEPMINAIVEESVKNPPKAILIAQDPTSIIEKKEDINLLRNRSIIERDRSELQSRVGLPNYKFGSENFNGNVDEFDKLGFNSDDQEDVNFYENNLQKLKWEIAGQSIIDSIFKNSRFDKDIMRRFVKDIFASKILCGQKYIDQVTGEIKDRYIDPQTLYGIFGQTNDGKDDICRGWQDQVTVMQWLQMVGNEFVFERDWRFLLWGINYCNNRKFTGFIRNGVPFDCCGDNFWAGTLGINPEDGSQLLDWTMAYTYKVYVGYIEWRSPEATSTFLVRFENGKSSDAGDTPAYVEEIPYSTVLEEKKIKEGYQKESRYQIPYYSSYFIATTSVSQWIWGFGKVYMQTTEGANDEYCNGTLYYYQEEGLSATEIAAPYLNIANFTFYRMLWIIHKAKPDPDEYVYEELLQLANSVQRQFPQSGIGGVATKGLESILTDIVKQMRAKHIRLRTYPKVDGRSVAQIHPIELKGRGGLDPIAMSMQAICQWAESNIAAKIGINSLRLGGQPLPRESTKSEENQISASMTTTGYIYRMIQYVKEHSAIISLNYAQDIVKYKASAPYKWLCRIAGIEAMEDIEQANKFAMHRCGLFIEDYNEELAKAELRQAAMASLQNGEIDIVQYGMITQTRDPRRALLVLGRLKDKANEKRGKAELNQIKLQDEMAQKQHQREMEKMNFDRITRWGQADREMNGYIAAAQVNKQGRIEVQQLKDANEIAQSQADKEAEISKMVTQNNLKQQLPLTTSPTVGQEAAQ